ncbi:angiotensin-converting enzyme-like [Haematobia irritans]|uniref:angiotensin-converting enzyme-like n=1 Tax=Haematobia irritans TaxID=7368 RepID=UPI003F5023ED
MFKIVCWNLVLISFYYGLCIANDDVCLTEECAKAWIAGMDEEYRQQHELQYTHWRSDIDAEIRVRDQLIDEYSMLAKFNWQSFENPQLRRQFEILMRDTKYPSIDNEFKTSTTTLKTLVAKKFTCSRFFPNECKKVSYLREIKPLITNSRNQEDIKWYWREWRNHMPVDVNNSLNYFIQYYRNLSMPDMRPSAIWYEAYDDSNMMEDFENYMTAIAPLYNEMHAHLRQAIREKYGNSTISDSGLIPHHLLEQALYQAWKKESILINPYPEKKLPNLQQELKGNWQPSMLISTANDFFESLGFDSISEQNTFTAYDDRNTPLGPECKTRINTHGMIQMTYCPKVNYKKLLTIHGDMAQVEYALLKNNLSVGYSQEACPGFSNALAEATILSVSTPKHLQQHLDLLKEYNYDDKMHLNFLYRMAVHALFSIPMYFVHEKLWIDMIDDRIKPSEYNCHYWNLMDHRI